MFKYPMIFRQNVPGPELYTVWYIDPQGKLQYKYYPEPVRLKNDNGVIEVISLTTGVSLGNFSGSGGGGGGFGGGGSGGGGGGGFGTRAWIADGGWQGIFTNFPPIEYSVFCTELTILGGQSIGIPYYIKIVGKVEMFQSSTQTFIKNLFFGSVLQFPGPLRAVGVYPDKDMVILFLKHGIDLDPKDFSTETKIISNTFFATPPSLTESLIFDSYPVIVSGDNYYYEASPT